MKKLVSMLTIFTVVALISFATGAVAAPNTFDVDGNLCISGGTTPQAIGTPMELWAGVGNEVAGELAGYITFGIDEVRINLTDLDNDTIPDMYPWVATAVHIHFAETVDGIPQTRTYNPIVGQFEYNVDSDLFEYVVEVADPYSSEIVIPVEFEAVGAIHVAVERDYSDVYQFDDILPEDEVDMMITYPQTGSYVELTLDNASFMNGVYDSWCADVDWAIDNNTWYKALMYSTYDEDLAGLGLFEQPENFDKINYLLNTFAAGDMVQPVVANCNPATSCGAVKPLEALTKGDIQRAIWILIDDNLVESGLGPWSQQRVNAILCDVNVNGEGFVPDCGEKTGFIVVPVEEGVGPVAQIITGQTQLSTIGIPCLTEEETGWGDGKFGMKFDGSQWGTYFNYDAQCVPE